MTTDAPSPERVEVEQVDRELFISLFAIPISRRHRVRDGTEDARVELQEIARHRIATAQASDAEIERLKAEAQGLQYACGEHFNKAARADRRALAAEAESTRLREALEPFAAKADEMERVAAQHDMHPSKILRSHDYDDCVRARAALAAGTSQEVGRG